MQTNIQKWGNSLAVRIPKAFAEEIGLDRDTPVEITVQNGQIVIKRVEKPKYTLDELLAQITEDNIHPEVDMGKSVGKEVWDSSE
jgi:antitoxin MazE